jgi:hypothetical protein
MGCRLRLSYPGMLCSVQCAYMARTRACSSFPSRRSLGRGMQGPIYQSCGFSEY